MSESADYLAEEGNGPTWTCPVCTYLNESDAVCAICAHSRFYCEDSHGRELVLHSRASSSALTSSRGAGVLGSIIAALPEISVPTLVNGALSGALTGIFAVVGACTGAVAGALAGRATDSGVLRGAGLGMVAGAVVSIEALEASRSFWRNARNSAATAASISSTVEYIEEMLQERLSQDGYGGPSGRRWQVDIDDMSYEELYEMFGPGRVAALGLSPAAVSRLPCHQVIASLSCDEDMDAERCSICLQDLVDGELARSLPACKHTFHMDCVDRWLSMHGLCPVCRQSVHS